MGARCVSLRAIVRVPFRSLRAVRVERQVNVTFDLSQPSDMLYELQRFFSKLGLTSGSGVLPDGLESSAVGDRSENTTEPSRLGSTSKESTQLQNVKLELTPAVKKAARVAIHAGQARLDSTFLDAGPNTDLKQVIPLAAAADATDVPIMLSLDVGVAIPAKNSEKSGC